METPQLLTYIHKYSAGDRSVEGAVCSAIAHTKLMVALAAPPSNQSNQVATVRILLEQTDSGASAFAFTSQDLLIRWCQSCGIPDHTMAMFGVDLCFSLKPEFTLLVDAGSDHSISLSVDQIKRASSDDLNTLPAVVPQRPGTARGVAGFDESGRQPSQYQPAVPVSAAAKPAASSNGAHSKALGRSNPTQFFTSPVMGPRKVDPSRPRQKTYSNSNLKKVIRPNSGEDSE